MKVSVQLMLLGSTAFGCGVLLDGLVADIPQELFAGYVITLLAGTFAIPKDWAAPMKRWYMTLGIMICFLALIGFGASVWSAATGTTPFVYWISVLSTGAYSLALPLLVIGAVAAVLGMLAHDPYEGKHR